MSFNEAQNFAVTIMQHVSNLAKVSGVHIDRIAGNLLHPVLRGMLGDPGQSHPTTL
jgi:hypothetical protein